MEGSRLAAMRVRMQGELGGRAGSRRYEVVAISAGEGNGLHYSPGVLEAALPLFEGVVVFVDHSQLGERWSETGGRSVRNVLGVLVAAAVLGLLVTLGVACLRDSGVPPDGGVDVQANTTFSGPLIVRGGIQAGNNITMTAGSLVNSNGAVTVTDDLLLMQPVVDGSGSVRIYDTLAITGNTTVTGDTALNGNVSTGTGSFRINDNALITGTLGVTGAVTADYHVSAAGNLTVTGNIAMSNGYLVSSKGGVTVTDELKVTSQATFDNGIVNTGNITNTGSLSVTAIASLYGLGLGLGSTQAITANYGITPGNASILYVTDDGGQASGTVTLDSTVSIVSGTRIGQLLLIMYVDTAGATMTIKDNGNVQLPSGSDLALGLYDSVLVMWDGTDWIAVNACDN